MFKIDHLMCANLNCPGRNEFKNTKTGEIVSVACQPLKYVEDNDYYYCTIEGCGYEVWQNINLTTNKITTHDAMWLLKTERTRQNQMRKKGGRSRPAGRKRTKKHVFVNDRMHID